MSPEAPEPARPPLPVTVKIAALGLFLLAARLFVLRMLPGLAAGDGEALAALPDLTMFLLFTWGVLRLRRWAWWLSAIACTAGVAFPAYLYLFADAAMLAQMEVDASALFAHFLVVGGLSGATLVMLLLPPSRDAFRWKGTLHGSFGSEVGPR